jgi:hypothetical protein
VPIVDQSFVLTPLNKRTRDKGKMRNQGAFGKYPPLSQAHLINFYFKGGPAAQDLRTLPGSTRRVVKVGCGTFQTFEAT